ncbi:uncharacterized protein LOC126910801 [Spodoptera frugiperda]|uniref:Uncharacterized protein LOC126910801 n=1 Tax=Spodoptera frugiperda TaxID=7108 RepID=A0A9R0DNS3_SPOFR|nr:uncharacterized protein LOC126910801 [Spodoptera frugiperda]
MSTQPLIANELLAFIQHAIDTMDEVSILQICKSNFKEEDISSGKKLLFQCLGKLDEMPARRRDGTEKSVQDIITLLKVTDPDDVPAFVAKDLHKLPPVTFDHVDVTRLLKDIISLKTSLAEVQSKLMSSENTIGELRAELLALRNAVRCKWVTKTVHRRRKHILQLMYRSAVWIGEGAGIATCGRCSESLRRTASASGAGYDTCEKKEKEEAYLPQSVRYRMTGHNHLLRPAVPATLLYVSRLHDSTKVEEIVEFIKIKAKLHLKVEQLHSQHRLLQVLCGQGAD